MQTHMKNVFASLFALALCLSVGISWGGLAAFEGSAVFGGASAFGTTSAFGIPAAFAAEQTTVTIPVSASGADCTAAIYDEAGDELQTLPLKNGASAAFELSCPDVGSYSYTVGLVDKDTETITYDKTTYSVNVEVYYKNDGTTGFSVSADPIGVLGDNGKPEELAFANKDTSGGSDGPGGGSGSNDPGDSDFGGGSGSAPETGDSGSIKVWAGLAAGSLCALVALLILFARKRRRDDDDDD